MDVGKFRDEWRFATTHPARIHTAHSLTTCYSKSQMLRLCVCSSKAPDSSGLVVPPLASSLPHRTSNARHPVGNMFWSVVSNYWIWSWVDTRPSRTSWRTEESRIPAMQLRLPVHPDRILILYWLKYTCSVQWAKEGLRKDYSNTCVLWNS
jgi:hypothetical protein